MVQSNEGLRLSKVLGNLYTEVFGRRPTDDNSPLKKSQHLFQDASIKEDTHSILNANTTIWVWGVSGSSPQTDSSPLAGEWGIGAWS